jgi:hypothetical protein
VHGARMRCVCVAGYMCFLQEDHGFQRGAAVGVLGRGSGSGVVKQICQHSITWLIDGRSLKDSAIFRTISSFPFPMTCLQHNN